MQEDPSEYVSVELLPLWRRAWWGRTRPCRRGVQLNAGDGLPACVEFYVPWWAWPLEVLHRLLFGRAKLEMKPR